MVAMAGQGQCKLGIPSAEGRGDSEAAGMTIDRFDKGKTVSLYLSLSVSLSMSK
jgi:hypothetical protein